MPGLMITPTFGLGSIQRAALIVLFAGLNEVIGEINTARVDEDIAFESFLNRIDAAPTFVETVEDKNFYEGHRPSLINAPIGNYPNCCAWCPRAIPMGESDSSDHTNIFNNLLYVEVMAKANPDEDEEVVNRRIERMAEAVTIVFSRDQTLGGKVSGLSTPTVNMSEVFMRRERSSSGPKWFWQGARLEYAVRKDAVLPSSTPGSVFQTARVSSFYADADIDQM